MPEEKVVSLHLPQTFAGQRLHILVVDDDPNGRLLLEEVLYEAMPCRVFSAASSQKAFQIASQTHLDVLLLDYHLGEELTGLDVYDHMCTHNPIPALLISADRPEIGSRPLPVLSKPWDITDLLTHIQRILHAHGIILR